MRVSGAAGGRWPLRGFQMKLIAAGSTLILIASSLLASLVACASVSAAVWAHPGEVDPNAATPASGPQAARKPAANRRPKTVRSRREWGAGQSARNSTAATTSADPPPARGRGQPLPIATARTNPRRPHTTLDSARRGAAVRRPAASSTIRAAAETSLPIPDRPFARSQRRRADTRPARSTQVVANRRAE